MKKIILTLFFLLTVITTACSAPYDGTLTGTGIIARDYFKDYYVVDQIIPGSPAAKTGKIKPNDRILKVNSTDEKGFKSVEQLNGLLNPSAGQTVRITVRKYRKDKVITTTARSRSYKPDFTRILKGYSIFKPENVMGNLIVLTNVRGNYRLKQKYLISCKNKLIGAATVIKSNNSGNTVKFKIDSLNRGIIAKYPNGQLKILYYQAAQKYLAVKKPYAVGAKRMTESDLKRNSTYARYARDKRYTKVTGVFKKYDSRSKKIVFSASSSSTTSGPRVYLVTKTYTLPCSPYVTSIPSGIVSKLSRNDSIIVFFERKKPRTVKLVVLKKKGR